MSIKIQCPQCREKYSAGEEYIGKRFKCRCGALVEVPDLNAFFRKTPEDNSGETEIKPPPKQENSPDARQEKTPDAPPENTPPARSGITAYGILAILFGTTGTLAILAAGTFAVSAFRKPFFGSAENDFYALAAAFGLFVVAFLLAAVFRLADLVIRRSGMRYFF